jgi:hypothetical protein
MDAKEILNKHTCHGLINTNLGIIAAMEEYACQQVREFKEANEKLRNTGALLGEAYYRITGERDKAVEMLEECRLQLEYLDKRFPTGTTPNVLSRVETLLESLNK